MLKNLINEQKNAINNGDMIQLNAINKKIFAIRQEQKKAKEQAREQERDARIQAKIEKILTL